MFGPLLGALITAALFDRLGIVRMLAVRPRFNLWWLVAWLAPAVIVGLAFTISLIMPGAEARSFTDGLAHLARRQGLELGPEVLAQQPPLWVGLVGAMVAGGTLNALVAIGEEAGWRGYLWTLLRPSGFWRASLITGVIWGLWHTPVIAEGHNYGTAYWGFPWLGVGMMVVFTVGLSPIHGFVRDRTGTAWAPAVLHGTLNALGGLVGVLVAGGHPLVIGVAGLAGTLALALVTLIVATQRPGRTAPALT
jgi:membrane protease YdiL (CAAX protease family)